MRLSRSCRVCDCPLARFGGDSFLGIVECARCMAKRAQEPTTCLRPGCKRSNQELSEKRRRGFCATHHDNAFPCIVPGCEYRADAHEPGQRCTIHFGWQPTAANGMARVKDLRGN